MSAAVSKSIVDLLIAGGVESREEAAQLAQNLNGGSWTTQVLDSGKVDEQRFLSAIGNFFRVPVVTLDAKTIDRQTLSILPSRFVFQHHILPIAEKDNSVVLATYDLFNSAGRQLVTQLLKKPPEWVLVPRAQLLRVMKTLYGVGAETFDDAPTGVAGFFRQMPPLVGLVVGDHQRVDAAGLSTAGAEFSTILIGKPGLCRLIGCHELFRARQPRQRNSLEAPAPEVVA